MQVLFPAHTGSPIDKIAVCRKKNLHTLQLGNRLTIPVIRYSLRQVPENFLDSLQFRLHLLQLLLEFP